MTIDDLLNKSITIREGINLGIISSRVLSDCDIFQRIEQVMEKENIPVTHAVERVSEMCKVCELTVWRAYSFTNKIMKVV